VRGGPRDRRDAGLRCGPGARRHRGPDRPAPADRPVLPGRVLRPVRSVPARHGAPGGAAGTAAARHPDRLGRARARAAGRHRHGRPRRLDLRTGPDRVQRGRLGPAPRADRRQREGARVTSVFLEAPRRLVDITVDGETVRVPEGATLLEACRQQGIDTPTLCYLENLTPVNVCRVCVVEVEKSRTLVPACSRKAESGMVVHTDSERVRTRRKMVLEFLASSVDVSLASPDVQRWMEQYGADPGRYGDPAPAHDAGERDAARPGEHHPREDSAAETVAQPVKYDND